MKKDLALARDEAKHTSAKVIRLEESITMKNSLDWLNASLKTIKAKIYFFLEQDLPSWKDRCVEEALFMVYKENIGRYSDLAFPFLDSTRIDYKRKFDIMIDRIPEICLNLKGTIVSNRKTS